MNATLFDDAAPLAGGAGASESNTSPDLTRLPLIPPAHHNAPAGTSDAAARSIAGYAPKLRGRILAFIVARGAEGATDDEGEAALGIIPQTYTPRRGELRRLGLVSDSGVRRKTVTGRSAAVWVAAVGTAGAAPAERGAHS